MYSSRAIASSRRPHLVRVGVRVRARARARVRVWVWVRGSV